MRVIRGVPRKKPCLKRNTTPNTNRLNDRKKKKGCSRASTGSTYRARGLGLSWAQRPEASNSKGRAAVPVVTVRHRAPGSKEGKVLAIARPLRIERRHRMSVTV